MLKTFRLPDFNFSPEVIALLDQAGLQAEMEHFGDYLTARSKVMQSPDMTLYDILDMLGEMRTTTREVLASNSNDPSTSGLLKPVLDITAVSVSDVAYMIADRHIRSYNQDIGKGLGFNQWFDRLEDGANNIVAHLVSSERFSDGTMDFFRLVVSNMEALRMGTRSYKSQAPEKAVFTYKWCINICDYYLNSALRTAPQVPESSSERTYYGEGIFELFGMMNRLYSSWKGTNRAIPSWFFPGLGYPLMMDNPVGPGTSTILPMKGIPFARMDGNMYRLLLHNMKGDGLFELTPQADLAPPSDMQELFYASGNAVRQVEQLRQQHAGKFLNHLEKKGLANAYGRRLHEDYDQIHLKKPWVPR